MLSFRRTARTFAILCALAFAISGVAASPATAAVPEQFTTIPVGSNPVAIATYADGNTASRDKDRIFVANYDSSDITVINAETLGTISTIPIDGHPSGIAINQTTGAAYVVAQQGTGYGTFTTIEPKTLTVSASFTIGRMPRGISVDPGSGLVYVTLRKGSAAAIDVIDTVANSVVKRIPNLGERPEAIAINPNIRKAFVANGGSDNVSIVDLANAATPTVDLRVGQWPVSICSATFNGLVYVANEGPGTVSVLNGRDNSIVDTIPVGGDARAVVEDSTASPNRLYVANKVANTVTVIDSVTRRIETTIKVGAAPEALAADHERREVYVANSGSNTISVIR